MLASLEGTPPPTLETRDGFSVRVLKADAKQGACCPTSRLSVWGPIFRQRWG